MNFETGKGLGIENTDKASEDLPGPSGAFPKLSKPVEALRKKSKGKAKRLSSKPGRKAKNPLKTVVSHDTDDCGNECTAKVEFVAVAGEQPPIGSQSEGKPSDGKISMSSLPENDQRAVALKQLQEEFEEIETMFTFALATLEQLFQHVRDEMQRFILSMPKSNS
jgi:hypothetical protein